MRLKFEIAPYDELLEARVGSGMYSIFECNPKKFRLNGYVNKIIFENLGDFEYIEDAIKFANEHYYELVQSSWCAEEEPLY